MIGKRIRVARAHKHLTLREVAEAMSVTPQAVGQWEKSNPKFDINKSQQIANVFDVSIDWLEGRIGEDNEVVESGNMRAFGTRVPLIPFHESLMFFNLNRNKSRDISIYTTLEPSVRIIGQSFAVKIDGDDAIGDLRDGDILIFDNGVSAKDGDIVIALVLQDNLYYTVLALCKEIYKGSAETILTAREETDAAKRIRSAEGSATIAVMVEFRRFRRGVPPNSR